MLPTSVQTTDTSSIITLILPLLLCCMLPTLFRGQSPKGTNETDSWFVSTSIQDAYDAVVRETDEWRNQVVVKKPSAISSLFPRGVKKQDPFSIDQAVPPRLYRVKDRDRGEISFELTEVEGGGTSIKSVYDSSARVLIQNFKAKLPAMIPFTAPKVCPSCGKDVMPEFKACPYCGTKLQQVE